VREARIAVLASCVLVLEGEREGRQCELYSRQLKYLIVLHLHEPLALAALQGRSSGCHQPAHMVIPLEIEDEPGVRRVLRSPGPSRQMVSSLVVLAPTDHRSKV